MLAPQGGLLERRVPNFALPGTSLYLVRKLVARMRQAARRATDTSQGRVAAISRAHPSTAKMMVQFMAAMGSLVYPSESKWSVSDGDGTKLRRGGREGAKRQQHVGRGRGLCVSVRSRDCHEKVVRTC